MIVFFADRRMDILGHASTRLPKGRPVVQDLKVEDVETGVATFECRIPYTKNTRKKVEAWTEVGNYLLRSHDGENEYYTIIETQNDTERQEVWIYAEDAGLDLFNEIVGEYEADQAYPISHYIEKFAYDSGFVIGVNEIPDLNRKLRWEGETTATERLASVATQFDNAEISFSFDIKGLSVTEKYINIYKKRGKDIGAQLRINKEVDKIITSKSIANLATALKVTGGIPDGSEVPITLDGYAYDDGDFFLEGTYLKSRSAVAIWTRYLAESGDYTGHICKTFSYDTISQEELCNRAISHLKKIREVEVNYEADIARLPDGVKVGDRVNIIDDAGELYLSTRILKLETSVADNIHRATLGEYIIKSGGISQKIAELAEEFAKNAASITKAVNIAGSAQDIANAASGAASAAQNAADEAKNSANAAAGAANAAQQAANNAQSTANNAQNTANEAQKDADAAQDTADEAKQEISDLRAIAITTENLSAKVADLGYATVGELEAEKARLTALEAEDVNIKKMFADYATVEQLKVTNANVSDLEAEIAKIDAAKIGTAEVESLLAEKAYLTEVEAESLYAKKAVVDELSSDFASFEEATTAKLTAQDASIGDLEAEDANIKKMFGDYATIENLNATNVTVTTLTGDLASFKETTTQKLTAQDASIADLVAEDATIKKVVADNLAATNAEIDALKAADVETNKLFANYATVKSLEVSNAKIAALETDTVKSKDLEATVGTFGYLKAETAEATYATITNLNTTNASVGTLQTRVADIENAYVNEAKVNNLIVAKGYMTEAQVETLVTNKGYITTLETNNLLAGYATVKDLEATNASIGDLAAIAITTNNLSAKVATLGYLQASALAAEVAKLGYLEADSLEAEVATFGYLKAATASATYATITNLDTTNANVSNLQASVADIESAYMDEAEVNTLVAGKGYLTEAQVNSLVAGKGYITTLETKNLLAGYATIDLANVKAGSITTAMIGAGVVGTAQIADGSITDAKIVGLTANKITAGTLDAGTIEVINLNAANITVGTINGQQIASGAIDTSKLTSSLSTTISKASTNASQALSNAADAQTTADNATALANTSYNKVTSKGEQLVVNGNGLMGDNTNFSAWIFDGAVANNSPGSFTLKSGVKKTLITDEYFPVNPTAKYTFSLDVKCLNGLARMYSFICFFDVDKIQITASQHMYASGSTTTLKEDLKSGDKVIYVTDLSGWAQSKKNHQYVAIWNYTNKFGYTYPPETYTRNRITLPATNALINDGVLDFTNNTITLTTAYSGATVPAGTYVSQGGDGNTYKYTPLSNTLLKTDWTSYTGSMNGVDYSGANKGGMFPPGTAYAKVGFLWNYNTAADQIWVTNISVTDTTLADKAQATATAAQTTADGKNTAFYQDASPASTNRKVNDIWFDTDDGNKMYYWSGSAWTAKQFGTNAIASASITNALIADATIQSAKIANLDAAKITTGTLAAARIASESITADKIATSAITTDKLNANAVTTAKLATGAVTAATIAADAVTAEKIATGAVTADSIASSAVTADKIVAGAVTADKLAASAVTANKIAAGAVTADKISVSSLEAICAKIGGFTIGATYLANATTSLVGSASSVYVGIDGISCGTAFKVDDAGKLEASNVDIQGAVSADYLYVNARQNFEDNATAVHEFSLYTNDTPNSLDPYGLTIASKTFASSTSSSATDYVIMGLWDTLGLSVSTTGSVYFESKKGVTFADKSSDGSGVMNVVMPIDATTISAGEVSTTTLTVNDLTISGNEQFCTHYIKRKLGSLSAGTSYANLSSTYKDGSYYRMWRLRFPAGCNFWGKIKVTLYGTYSSFNASGVMSKSITCNFNGSTIYNNVGCYDGLGVNVEKDFRISEAIWNSTASAWEILIWQKNLSGNNSPQILIEAWAANQTFLTNIANMTATAVELTQATTYTASKASSTGGTKTVTWSDTPVYETPLGLQISTADHTHSTYALTSHTHSDYALASHTHSYMPLSGGQFTGPVSFSGAAALPTKTLSYICGIDAFASGGQMGWQSKSDFLSGYATTSYVSSNYSTLDHTHSDYALSNHTHSTYASTGHTHSDYLPKTTYEYSAELAMGSTGKVCIGKFSMYDSNITVRISSTTNTTYNGTLVIATQNYGTASGGSLTANVYGDVSNTIAPNIYIYNVGTSGVVEVYFSPSTYSKNLIHVQAMALRATPTDVVTSITSIPSTATTKPTNLLTSALDGKAASSHSHSEYSLTNHTHSNYAATSHTHSEYASSSHTHSYLPLSGGTLTGALTLSNSASAQSGAPALKWGTYGANSNTPYIGFATDQSDGTFVWSLQGSTYATGLAIGGGSGNLLWKGTKVATTSDNVASASKLATARTISLTGDAVGSGSFDGSGNLAITTTVANSIPLVIGTQTAATGTWTGVASFSELKDGQSIRYWLPYNGSGNATLNLTLSNGSTTGAKNVYLKGTTRLTTHYAAGSSILLTYFSAASVAGTEYAGWWAHSDYNSDSKVSQAAAVTTNSNFPVLLAYSTATTAVTNAVKKSSTLLYNPSTQTLTSPNVTASGVVSAGAVSATSGTFSGSVTAADLVCSTTGLNFGSVQTGTWTPSANGLTSQTAYGTYMKVGTMVVISFYVTGQCPNSAGTMLSIGGVPFTPKSGPLWYGGGGHAQGMTGVSEMLGASFSGWVLQTSDSRIYARTVHASSSSPYTMTGTYAYIGGTGTVYMAGTILYQATS